MLSTIIRSFWLVLFAGYFLGCNAQPAGTSLEPLAFRDAYAKEKQAVLLDVRTPSEWTGGILPNAVLVDYQATDFETRILKMNRDLPYFVYCLSGGRSASAAAFMREQGFKRVYELQGGTLAWSKAGLALANAEAVQDKISAYDYQQLIQSDELVLVDFYAPWCGPCRQMEPLLNEMTAAYKGKATIIRINVDENKNLQRALRIDEIPFFKRYKKGLEAGNFIGQLDRASFVNILDGK